MSNQQSQPYRVIVTVIDDEGDIKTYAHTYGTRPVLIGVEEETNPAHGPFLSVDMTQNYVYWQAMFGGCEFNFLDTEVEVAREDGGNVS